MYNETPFGNPEGSRAEIDDIMANFIESNYGSFTSIIDDKTCADVRVVVGSKGSGKTVYLKRYCSYIENKSTTDDSFYIYFCDTELPSTDLVIRFCQLWNSNIVTEKWVQLWKCALSRSLVSHILCADKLNAKINDNQRKTLRTFETVLYPKINCELSAYAELKNILTQYKTHDSINNYLNHMRWEELDNVLGKILKNLPQIYFFVDCVDEEYHNAPMYWMRCQKGLFMRALKLFSSSHYKRKFNVVVSIRDQVYSSILESDDKTKYLQNPQIKVLKWNYKAIRHFLELKVTQLPDCYFCVENSEKNIDNWLGLKRIKNIRRSISESTTDYIIRHTRLSPRDIVILGNELSQIKRSLHEDPSLDIEEFIRDKVASCAFTFGDELFDLCANQILSSAEGTKKYSSGIEFEKKLKDIFREVFINLGLDCISKEQLDEALEDVIVKFGMAIDSKILINALWQAGGIGYLEATTSGKSQENFFVDNDQLFRLPSDKEKYVFSSCVKDNLGIKVTTIEPVFGCRKR